MSWFNQPDMRPLTDKGHKYIVAQPYQYYWVTNHIPKRILIPEGYILDGASSPRWAWTLTGFLPDGPQRKGSLVHDHLYGKKGKFHNLTNGEWISLTRKECDQVFFNALKEENIHPYHALMAYYAVRLFGWLYWNDII